MESVLKIEKSKFKIDIFGTICEVRKPTWSEIENFQQKITSKELGEAGSLSLTRELLVALGVKEELVSELELDHVSAIMDLLVPKKKA